MNLQEKIQEEILIEEYSKNNQIQKIANSILDIYEEHGVDGINDWCEQQDLNNINEGVLGGALGFLTGPMIGKVIARALGCREGVLYDMLTNRIVSMALGHAIQKAM